MAANTLRKFRPWVQASALILFLVLLIGAGRIIFPPTDLVFRLDPLAVMANLVAARRAIGPLLVGALVAIVAALILGRVWCGWLCPLGTILDWTPAHRSKPKETDPSPRWRSVKYFLLFLIGVTALLGNLTFLILDPITLLYRTAATAAWPAFNALLWGVEKTVYRVPWLQGPVDLLEETARGVILPAAQPLYGLGMLSALLFAGILALNAVRDRFWCRYLCPLGGLLGLVSKLSWLRRTVGSQCIECQRCARACPTGTIDAARGYESDPSECIMCLECVPVCSRLEQHFAGRLRPAAWQTYDPSRRQFLAATGTAVLTTGLFGAEPAGGHDHLLLVRPPGAQRDDFLSRCIRCGMCVKICPTGGLQPSLEEAGWVGLWTPVLAPRLGHCDYSCNACGRVCPVEAISRLSLAEKRQQVIGHAYIDRDRCIPWADNRTCLVCEEMCPLPEKAIELEDVTAAGLNGEPVAIRRPYVLRERCIGCGICENRCPLNGESAIRVYAPTDLSAVG